MQPSAFIRAHRIISQNAGAPFRQWRLSLVVLLVSTVPVLLGVAAFTYVVFLYIRSKTPKELRDAARRKRKLQKSSGPNRLPKDH